MRIGRICCAPTRKAPCWGQGASDTTVGPGAGVYWAGTPVSVILSFVLSSFTTHL
jgi:hypothetical protein